MLVEPIVGEEQENECSPCIPSITSNCDNYSDNSIAPAAGPGVEDLPVDAIQCPLRYPFTKYQDYPDKPSFEIGYCCKCQDQTNCEPAAEGVNYYNIGGVNAMMEDNETVDESKFLVLKFHFKSNF